MLLSLHTNARPHHPGPAAAQVRGWLGERLSTLEAQRGLKEAQAMDLLAAESELRMAQAELDFMADSRAGLAAQQVRGWAALGLGVCVHARLSRVWEHVPAQCLSLHVG